MLILVWGQAIISIHQSIRVSAYPHVVENEKPCTVEVHAAQLDFMVNRINSNRFLLQFGIKKIIIYNLIKIQI